MMKAYLVTEGSSDAALLQPMLNAIDIRNFRTMVAGGKALTTSLARSIAIAKKVRVAVVVDSDTLDESTIRQHETIFKDLTKTYWSKAGCRLFQARPSLEEDLFRDPTEFTAVFGIQLSEAVAKEFQTRKQVLIRNALKNLSAKSMALSPKNINVKTARMMLDRSNLKDLVSFLQEANYVTAYG